MEPVTFSIRLPAEMADKLKQIARTEKRSRSNTIRVLLAEALAARGVK